MNPVDLSTYDNRFYQPGRSRLPRACWLFLGLPLLSSPVIPFNAFRVRLLALFGAKLAPGVVVKPGVRVKYPWRLWVGAHSWLGEDCWIDNLADVHIGDNVCISQGAYLCTGNHNWSDPGFGLLLGPVTVEDGAWVGARSIVCPGVTVGRLAVLTAGSVAQKDLRPYEIHGGNPAQFRRVRPLQNAGRSGGSTEES